MSSRAALHLLLDQIPDAALPKVQEVLATLAANDQLTPEEEAAIEAGLASAAAGRVIAAAAKREPRRGA
jgi:predicted transcriptional regulator